MKMQSICKIQNRESGNGMRGMMEMREVIVVMRGIRVGMQGIGVENVERDKNNRK